MECMHGALQVKFTKSQLVEINKTFGLKKSKNEKLLKVKLFVFKICILSTDYFDSKSFLFCCLKYF